MKVNKKILLTFMLISSISFAQYNGSDWAFSLSYSYTTTAKLFPFPNSADLIERNLSEEVDNIYSYSFETRYKFTDVFAVGLILEYIEDTKKQDLIVSGPLGSVNLKVDEGFSIIPIELAAYYLLPFSTDDFKFHMGGGVGAYIGNHIRNIGSAKLKSVEQDIAYGIHVNIGMDYMVFDYLSVRGEMRFRDPQFDTISKYDREEVTIDGRKFFLSQNTIDSKINMDGITFTLGLVFHTF